MCGLRACGTFFRCIRETAAAIPVKAEAFVGEVQILLVGTWMARAASARLHAYFMHVRSFV